MGYDGTYESSFFHPALTTVSLDLDLQGKEAVRRLLDSGHGDSARSSSVLPAKLIVRHSTGGVQEQEVNLQDIARQLQEIAHKLWK